MKSPETPEQNLVRSYLQQVQLTALRTLYSSVSEQIEALEAQLRKEAGVPASSIAAEEFPALLDSKRPLRRERGRGRPILEDESENTTSIAALIGFTGSITGHSDLEVTSNY